MESEKLDCFIGVESNPKLSHDGRWVAYNHPVDGVFVVPFEGGEVKQLTFKGNRGAVLGWTVDGWIAYAGYESAPFPDAKGLSFVRPTGGQSRHTGVAEIGYAWFDPQGDDMIFSKSSVSTGTNALFHGGNANQILRLNLRNGKYENLFPSKWSRHAAVMFQGEAYFVGSEGEAALNLWKVNDMGSIKLTDFRLDGIRNLSCDGERMIVEQRGNLFWLHPADKQLKPIPITLLDLAETPLTLRCEVKKNAYRGRPDAEWHRGSGCFTRGSFCLREGSPAEH